MSTNAPQLSLVEVDFFERPVVLRMPFRFGVVTLTEAPQCFVRVRIRLADGREGSGWAAEILAPKWFDKDPALTNEDNFDQLRRALAMAEGHYRAVGQATAFGLHAAAAPAHAAAASAAGLPPLVASFGPALVDRAILDAVLRLAGTDVFAGVQANVMGLDAGTARDLDGFDMGGFLASLKAAPSIAARHTVGLVDPIEAADQPAGSRVGDGLPETLREVIDTYGVTHFKLKVGGDLEADIDRLCRIAAVTDAVPGALATLDGNEQYADADAVAALWRRMTEEPRLQRLCQSVLFIEQPINRAKAMEREIGALAALKPVEIDESDGTIDAFPDAKALGYTGVSSKSCKGFYKALLNRARCAKWNAEAGQDRYFMSAEDLTTQAGLAVQQDLALATLIGCSHVERNGHHYVKGMSAAPAHEQQAFLAAHPDLYHEQAGTVCLRIEAGQIALGSLATPGLASGALPAPADLITVTYEA
jgi:hypothetical protein